MLSAAVGGGPPPAFISLPLSPRLFVSHSLVSLRVNSVSLLKDFIGTKI